MSPTSGATIAITAVERRIVLALLKEHLPDTTAWVYGSRVAGTARANSDLDLVVFTTPEQMRQVGELRDAFEESNLPFRVDLFVWDAVPENFRAGIERRHAVLATHSQATMPDPAITGAAWPTACLGAVADIRLSSVDKKTKPNEHAVRLCNYTDVYRNTFIRGNMDFMPATATDREIEKCSLAPRDVVITKDSEQHDDIGVPALVRDSAPDIVCGYHLAILRPSPERLDGAYLFYALSTGTAQQQFHSYANGVTRFGLRKSDIARVEIPLSPLDEQRAIGDILQMLDDKIELNHCRNETLEAMAEATFRDWFVDFGPVRAKMENRTPYLPPELWKLFPTHLANSTLGSVPDGWDIKPLGECYDLTMGQSPPGISYNEAGEGLPFFQGCTDFGFRYPENRRFCSAPARTARAEDTLVSVRAPVGDMNLAWEKCCIGRGVAALRHESDSPSFTYYSVQAMRPEIRQFEHTGTVFGAITRKQFEGLSALNPPGVLISAYDGLVSGIDEQIRLNTSESRALAFARDTLLPRLISGKIRPSSAKAFLAELP